MVNFLEQVGNEMPNKKRAKKWNFFARFFTLAANINSEPVMPNNL